MGEIFGVYALKVLCILLGMYFICIAGFYCFKYRKMKTFDYRTDFYQIIIWLVILTIIVLSLAMYHFEHMLRY